MGTLSPSLSVQLITHYPFARGISIALAVHSLDPTGFGASVRLEWDFYRVKISIVLVIHSVDPIRSLDPTYQMLKNTQLPAVYSIEGVRSEIAARR